MNYSRSVRRPSDCARGEPEREAGTGHATVSRTESLFGDNDGARWKFRSPASGRERLGA